MAASTIIKFLNFARRAKSRLKMRHLILPEIRSVADLQEISLWNNF